MFGWPSFAVVEFDVIVESRKKGTSKSKQLGFLAVTADTHTHTHTNMEHLSQSRLSKHLTSTQRGVKAPIIVAPIHFLAGLDFGIFGQTKRFVSCVKVTISGCL